MAETTPYRNYETGEGCPLSLGSNFCDCPGDHITFPTPPRSGAEAPTLPVERPTAQPAEEAWQLLLRNQALYARTDTTWQAICRIMEDRETLAHLLQQAEARAVSAESAFSWLNRQGWRVNFMGDAVHVGPLGKACHEVSVKNGVIEAIVEATLQEPTARTAVAGATTTGGTGK